MNRPVQVFVTCIWLAGAVCLAMTDWRSLVSLSTSGLVGLGGLIAIALLSESLAIGVSVGASGGSTASVAFVPLLASVQLFGPAAGVLLFGITTPFAELFVRRKGLFKASFNTAQTIIAATLAGSAFLLLGGQPLQGVNDPNLTNQLGPFISFGLVFLAVNHAAVSLAITLSQGLPFRRVWHRLLANTGASLNDILISPIALAVAFLYVQFGIAGILVVLLPMLFIRYSYLTTSKLRESNSDLLTALVKAIEIRDPYTSGHSLRVSQLAQRIAEELGLEPRLVRARLRGQEVKPTAHLAHLEDRFLRAVARGRGGPGWDQAQDVLLLGEGNGFVDELVARVAHPVLEKDRRERPAARRHDQIGVDGLASFARVGDVANDHAAILCL